MGEIRFQDIWHEQIDAAADIRERFGALAAFDYIVAEKLINYVEASMERPEFARELPKFVGAIRGIFAKHDLRCYLSRLELELKNNIGPDAHLDEADRDLAETSARRLALLLGVKDVLVVEGLGTS